MQRWSPNGSNALKASIEALKCANEPVCAPPAWTSGGYGESPPE